MKLYRVWRGVDSQGGNLGWSYTYDYTQAMQCYSQGLVVYELGEDEDKWTTIMFDTSEVCSD